MNTTDSQSPSGLNFCGQILQLLYLVAYHRVRHNSKGNGVLGNMYNLAQKIDYHANPHYSSEFLEILNLENKSFIFYGDHSSRFEPLLLFLSLPDKLKKALVLSEQKKTESSTKLIMAETTLLLAPFLRRYALPIINTNASMLWLYKKRFLQDRLERRSQLNAEYIDNFVKHISVNGNNLIIFPQGKVNSADNPKWKRGLIRIAMGVNNSENIFLVPFSINGVRKTDFLKMLFRVYASYFGIKKKKKFDIFYGKPVSVKEFLSDLPSGNLSNEDSYEYAKRKITFLQDGYIKWENTIR